MTKNYSNNFFYSFYYSFYTVNPKVKIGIKCDLW